MAAIMGAIREIPAGLLGTAMGATPWLGMVRSAHTEVIHRRTRMGGRQP